MGFGFEAQRNGRLPAQLSSFVGRAEELGEIGQALDQGRLVTLVGPGGIGKSRTGVHAAHACSDSFPDGVWFAELSGLSDPELLPGLLASALDVPEHTGRERESRDADESRGVGGAGDVTGAGNSAGAADATGARMAMESLVSHLRGLRLLIVLDTCEHLLDACAAVCGVLLRAAPQVRVLATSRQPLGVPGERLVPIGPLERAEAMDLFTQRAALSVAGWQVTEANRPRVVELVERLEGIPLALKLAAVRLRVAPLEELTARRDNRFDILTGTQRGGLDRHQTLRTAIGWSYELCTADERLLWQRLSVFAGPFDLAAAEQVCADGRLPAERVVAAMFALVDKSVVQCGGEGGGGYRMLESIRAYAAERMDATGDAGAVRERHFAHYERLAGRLWDESVSGAQVPLHRAVRDALAEIRQALRFACAPEGPAARGLWLAARLAPYWRAAGLLSEGRYWIDKGLALVPEDCPERAWGLLATGWFAAWTADPDPALARFTQAREVALRCGEERVVCLADPALGALRALLGEVGEGLAAVEAGRRRLVERRDALGVALIHYEAALLLGLLGRTERALELCETGLTHLEGTGERQFRAATLAVKGLVLWLAGRPEECAPPLHQALEDIAGIGDFLVVALCCLGLGRHAAHRQRPVRAAWLLGHADSAARLAGCPVTALPLLAQEQNRVLRGVRAALGDEEFDRWHATGARMSGAEVLQAVRAGTERPVPRLDAVQEKHPGPAPGQLTAREREVAALVAEGLSNRQIAERLVISKRTADTHVERILAKLGITSRTQVPSALHT
ncbi:ATP-binding protein [Streptomyces sp. NPDC090106]|uniref:ATP-binding protein n=1 Tax=Streptomyces sp. NPDC090106 TaxID=3365946 RepID=UPI003824500A